MCYIIIGLTYADKMTLDTVLNWLTEHAVRYNHSNLLGILSKNFNYIVPHEVTFPDKQWMVVLGILDKMLRYRRKKQRKNVAVDQSLKKCEFWRRLQKLLLNIFRQSKDQKFIKENSKRFIEFISKVKSIELMIFSKEFLAPQLDVKMDDHMVDTQSQGEEKDNLVFGTDVVKRFKSEVHKNVTEIAPFAEKEFSYKVDLKIVSVIEDDFIIDLRQFIANDILKSQPTGLERFLGCRDDFEVSSDPYIQILWEHTKVSLNNLLKCNKLITKDLLFDISSIINSISKLTFLGIR